MDGWMDFYASERKNPGHPGVRSNAATRRWWGGGSALSFGTVDLGADPRREYGRRTSRSPI